MTSGGKPFNSIWKNGKSLPAEKFWNILAFDKESKRTLPNLISADSFIKNNNLDMTLGIKFILCLNGKFSDFEKKLHSHIMDFQLQDCE